MVEMKPVVSSNVDAVGFDEVAGAMHVRFKSGQTYAYADVPKATFDQAMSAKSIGRFVAFEIVPNFKLSKTKKVDPSP